MTVTLSRLHITVFLGLTVVLWGLVLFSQDTPVTKNHLAPFSTVVGFLVLLAVAFEHVLWRMPWLHGWFVKRPDLRGTWAVELRSDWVDPVTAQQIGPINCYMGVTQTLSKLHMHLMTPESESWFIAESINPSPKGDGYQLAGVYTNQPHVHLRGNRSEIHLGALVLDTHGSSHARPMSLTGEYWTDRKTKGTITLSGRVDALFTSYAEASEQVAGGADQRTRKRRAAQQSGAA